MMMKRLTTTLCILFFYFQLLAQESEYQKLTASEAEEDAWFGYDVDMFSDYMIVGARNEDVSEEGAKNDEGAIYFFKRGADGFWEESQRLVEEYPYGYDDYLGHSVAITDSYAIASVAVNIGESYSSGRYPYAVIYELGEDGSWFRADSIYHVGIEEYDDYGESVDINDEWAAVGNDDDDEVYMYQRQLDGSWDEVQVIGEPGSTSSFGGIVRFGPNYLVIGGEVDEQIYTYFYNDVTTLWELQDEFEVDNFVADIAVMDSVMVVGDVIYDNSSGEGVAYVYLLQPDSTWSFSEALLSPDGTTNHRFGYSVAIDTNHIVITTRQTNKAYSYERQPDNTFDLKKTLQLQSSQNHEVAMFDGDVVISDWQRTENSIIESGALYMYAAGDMERISPNVSTFSLFGSPTSSSTSLVFDIIFDEDVSGLTTDHFSIDLEVGDVTGNVVGVAAVSSSNHRISVSGISGNGFFSLALKNDDQAIVDGSGNPLTDDVINSVIFYSSQSGSSVDSPFSGFSTVNDFTHPLSVDQANDKFGYSADLEDGTAVIGAPGYNSEQGTVFVFEKSGSSWSYSTQLTSFLTTTSTANVGKSVAIYGDFIFAGAPEDTYNGDSDHGGVVYWYNGAEQSTIRGDNGAANYTRGEFLSVNDSTLVFSSEDELIDGFSTGSAYVYTLENDGSVTYETTLTPSYKEDNMHFGTALANNEDYIIVGAHESDERGTNEGAVYIFKRNESDEWEEHQVLHPSSYDPNANNFGFDLALDGNLLVVGSYHEPLDYLNYEPGAAYVYHLNAEGYWEEEAKLFVTEGIDEDFLGYRVDIDGGVVYVQADRYENSGTSKGKVYSFFREANGNWREYDAVATGSNSSDFLGRALAFENFEGIVGIPNEDSEGSSSGRAFFMSLSNSTNIWNGTEWTDGTPADSEEVYFSADYPFTASEELEIGETMIASGVQMTLENEATLIVNGDLANNGSVEVASGSSLMTKASTITGNNFTMKRETTFNNSVGSYSIVGSPIDNAPFSSLGTDALIYGYDESEAFNVSENEGLDRYKTPTELGHSSMQTGVGYFSAFTGDQNGMISFSGKPNTGDITVSLGITDHPSEEDAFEGFQLIANPYPAGISYDSIIDNYGSLIEGEIYLWDDGGSSTRRTDADYITVTKAGITGGSGSNSKVIDTDKIIGSMQGFFVKAKSTGDLIFTDEMKVSGNNADAGYFRTESSSLIRLSLEDQDGYNETLITFSEKATTGFDFAYDGRKFKSNDDLQLYSLLGETPMSIQYLPLGESKVELGMDITEAQNYTLHFSEVVFQEGMHYVLIDHLLESELVIEEGMRYQVSLDTKQEGRFSIETRLNEILHVEDLRELIMLSKYGEDLRIDTALEGLHSISIHSIDGRQLFHSLEEFNNKQVVIHPSLDRNVLYILSINDRKVKFILQ